MRIEAIEFQLGSRVEGLSDLSDDNPEWQTDRLFAKTGVERRHLLASNETPLRLAEGACNRLFQQTGKRKVGGLIYVTQSPESTIPTTACLLHETLGLEEACLAFDLNQGCSGFVYGLSVASGLIKSQAIDSCLVVCGRAIAGIFPLTTERAAPYLVMAQALLLWLMMARVILARLFLQLMVVVRLT